MSILTKNIRETITPALQEFSRAVGCTAGPKGRLVAIRKNSLIPHLTKDGMTVASAFRKDGFEGVAIDMVRQSAIETGKKAGDGTTTASVMSVALYEATETEGVLEALEQIRDSGLIEEVIDEMTIRVEGYDQLYGVTHTACNGDPLIAEPIARVFSELGPHAAVTVREDRTQSDIVLEMTKGASFPAGFASPYFLTGGASKVVLQNPYIWFSTVPLNRTKQIAPVLQAVSTANHRKQQNRPLLVIAPTVSDEALSILLVNNAQGRLASCAISSAFEGSLQVAAVTDLGVVCGYKITSKEIESINENNLEEFLGSAKTVVVEAKTTSFVGPAGTKEKREELIKNLEEQLLTPEITPEERKNLQTRLGIVNGQAAIIRVGGVTPSQITERKDRADDAVATARWALIEGVLPGSGSALFAIHERVLEYSGKADLGEEAAEALVEAFMAPFYRVAENAGIEEREFLHSTNRVEQDDSGQHRHYGLDLRTGEVVDLIERFAFDSAYAVKEATRTAVSSAINLARCEAMILQRVDDFS